jgi:dipeptidyl aminopeptidase/acylaminoacyl peptidase
MRIRVDSLSGRAIGRAVRVTSLLAADAFDVARNNYLVHVQTSTGAQARTFVLGGTDVPRRVVGERSLTEGTARIGAAAVSPDGLWVAYTVLRGADADIHVMPFAGGPPRAVAATPAREEASAWSPDGSRIAFAYSDSAARAVMVVDASEGAPQRVGSLPGPASPDADASDPLAPPPRANWSASGRHLAYYSEDLRRIVLLNFERGTESIVRVPQYVGTGHTVLPSPNGTQLLATTRVRPDDDHTEISLVFRNGRQWRRIPGPPGEAIPIAWQRNGWIYLVRDRGVATEHGTVQRELWRMRGPMGRPELYAALPAGCGAAVSISADATRGVCNYTHVESDLYISTNFDPAGR